MGHLTIPRSIQQDLVSKSREVKPDTRRHSTKTPMQSIKVSKHPIFSVQFRLHQILFDKETIMDNMDWIENMDEEMEASIEERQILSLKVNYLSSIETFTLDTLI
jgi:hypothetical protein